MSQESEAPVMRSRPAARTAARRDRAVEERIFVRFPALARALALFWSRLPPRSRLRHALLRRLVSLGYAAANRRDFDSLLVGFDPALEFHVYGGGLMPPDLVGVQLGHEGYRESWRRLLEAFPDIRLVPEEVIDLGGQLLVTIQMVGHGAGSGAPVRQPVFQLYSLRRGLVVKQVDFLDRSQALEAAGLSE